MNIQYKIKVFNSKKEFKLNIENDFVNSWVNIALWVNIINSANFSIKYNKYFENILLNDYIEIYEYKNTEKQLIFAWFVDTIQEIISDWSYNINIHCKGIWLLLTNLIYQNSTANDNKTATDIITDMFTRLNNEYPNMLWVWTIDDDWATIKIELKNKNFLQVYKELSIIKWQIFYIRQDWKIDFIKEKNTEYSFIVWNNINNLNSKKDTLDLYNSLLLTYNQWNTTWLYENTNSIAEYWQIRKHITMNDILDDNTANDIWNLLVTEHWEIKEEYNININTKFLYLLDDLINSKFIALNIWKKVENSYIKSIKYNNWKIQINTKYKEQFNELINNIINK